MTTILKYKFIFAILMFTFVNEVYTQPTPTDKGTDPGGDPLGPPLGAPIDDFVWGVIGIALIYGLYRWYYIKRLSTHE